MVGILRRIGSILKRSPKIAVVAAEDAQKGADEASSEFRRMPIKAADVDFDALAQAKEHEKYLRGQLRAKELKLKEMSLPNAVGIFQEFYRNYRIKNIGEKSGDGVFFYCDLIIRRHRGTPFELGLARFWKVPVGDDNFISWCLRLTLDFDAYDCFYHKKMDDGSRFTDHIDFSHRYCWNYEKSEEFFTNLRNSITFIEMSREKPRSSYIKLSEGISIHDT